jgi:hypothetical protein
LVAEAAVVILTHRLLRVAERSKARVCFRSPAGITGSNPAGGMDVRLLLVLCVVR